jgi:hypothetical protein
MDNPAWPTSVSFGWSVEWDPSPAGSRLAVTLRSDTRPWAEHGVHFRDMCSRVIFSFRCESGQAVLLVSFNSVCISLLKFKPGL